MKHKDELENELIIKYKPGVVGLTETHVTKWIEELELHIKGYVCEVIPSRVEQAECYYI